MVLKRLITYPESAQFRDEEWFKDEALPANDRFSRARYGTEAYWIPVKRLEYG